MWERERGGQIEGEGESRLITQGTLLLFFYCPEE